jgi:hypothetical protein
MSALCPLADEVSVAYRYAMADEIDWRGVHLLIDPAKHPKC